MGFYPPATLVRDAQRHGVEILPVDVNLSAARCVVELGMVRISLDYVASVGETRRKRLVERARCRRAVCGLRRPRPSGAALLDGLEALVSSGACDGFGCPRRNLLWELGLVFRAAIGPGNGGEAKQLPLSLGRRRRRLSFAT